ncbi:MAG: TonB-linked SusC/RagA family outer membrane protein [Sediminicola sp.]|jgi:TonB-linked SusC/RagA family outer membrane protein
MKSKLTWILTSFMVLCISFSFAQGKTISGNVTDQAGLPLPGVSVVVVGTTTGTQTDFDGNYMIKANSGQVLRFSYVGQKTTEKLIGAANAVNVQLEDDAQALEEVVVVAYGLQSKKKSITSVSTISSEAIDNLVVTDPQSILQGQAAGVQVVGSSGVLGAAPEVRIRGNSSIGTDSRPLFVIDGVPLGDDFLTGTQGGGQGLNPLASINPNDIANITVLKSASATALYGSRGANGVVLITTKTGGTDGKVKVTFDVNTSFARVTDTPDLLNTEEFIQVRGLNGTNVVSQGADIDFIDLVLREAVSTSYNLGISGGNKQTSYFVGVTYEDQEGILVGNNLQRTSFRSNLKTKANDWLTVGLNFNGSLNKFDRTPSENAFAAPYTIAGLQRPDVPIRDADGNFTTAGNVGGGNVVAQELLELNLSTQTRIIGNMFAEIDLSSFVGGLKFKSDIGIDRVSVEAQQRDIEILTPGGSAFNSIDQQNRLIATQTLSFDRTFADKHTVNVIGGFAYEQNDRRSIAVEGTGFLSDALLNVDSASLFPTTSSNGTASRLVSQFARGTYDFDNGKYVFEGSFRRDGSSRFGANNQYGTFWSAALGWNVSDENFLKDVSWIQDLKLNASTGTSGNDRIGNFASLGTFFVSPYNGNSGLRPTTLPNPDLRWEKTTGVDAGISASFFNRRLNLGVEYYKRTTNDLILFVPLDGTFNNGLNGRNENVGEVENSGFDINISSVNVNSGKFKWTTNLNLGFVQNQVTSLPETASVDEAGRKFVALGGSFSGQRAIEGESINSFYLIRAAGVNAQTGDFEWLDVDGNLTTTPTQADRVIAGQANPDWVGGLTNNFTFGNFTLSTLFNFSYGNDIFLNTRVFTENVLSCFNKTTRTLSQWQNPGENALIPSPSSTTIRNYQQASTSQLEDGSFLRLKNVTLNYNLPRKYFDEAFISAVRIYATATNLATFKGQGLDGYDPETSRGADGNGAIGEEFFNIPQAATVTLGLNVSF